MRVGFFLGSNVPQIGGNFTFEDNIFNALLQAKSAHQFYFFYYGPERQFNRGDVTFISLTPIARNIERSGRKNVVSRLIRRILLALGIAVVDGKPFLSPLEIASSEQKIEFMYFLTPRFEMVSIPFATTVLDLEHRVHPFFPEVSVTGSTWENRERHYQTKVRRAAYVITGTEAGKNEIIKFYHVMDERVRVLSFPVPDFVRTGKDPAVNIRKKYGIKGEYLFYPAQFWPHKNHIALLSALKVLKDRHALDFSLVFTGSDKGNLRYVQERTDELGLKQHVHFLGFVPADDVIALYKNAFALVFVSFFGPDNLPPLEAFALGCPVIAAKVSGVQEQLGDAALLVDQTNEEGTAAAVKKLHENPELKRTLTERGLTRAMRSSRDYADDIISILDEFAAYRRCWSSTEKYIHT